MISNFNNKYSEAPFMVCFTRKEAMELLLSLVGDEDKMPIRLFKVNDGEVRFKFILLLSELLTADTDQPIVINYNKDGTITHE